MIDNCATPDVPPQFCRRTLPFKAQTDIKISAVYPVPWWHLQASAVYQNLPGVPRAATYVAANAEIVPSLGRNLAACPNPTGPCNATAVVDLIEPNTLFEPRGSQVDLRVSKIFRFGTSRVQANVDVYNAPNESDVLSLNNRYGPQWWNAIGILPDVCGSSAHSSTSDVVPAGFGRGAAMTSGPHVRFTVGILLAIMAIAPGYAHRSSGPAGTAIAPFTVHVPDAVLADLKARLTRARFPEELDGSGWTHGTNLAYLEDLAAYWRDGFDWRAQERRLNQFEQFKTNIDGIAVHFIHRRSKEPHALPLILIHGWPGSFAEFAKAIGPLTDPVRYSGRPEDAFDVVVPSLPGYGFSDKPPRPGFGRDRTAELFVKLMARLGYVRYGAQGGDLGAGIATKMALADASHVVGLHLNLCSGEPPDPANPLAGLPAEDVARMQERRAFWTDDEQGYSHIQGTKPQTIGSALNDSPVGLAAWIVEKFRTWCDCDGNPEKAFTKDELLTNITIYWVTQTAASAARFYYENRHAFEGRPAALSPEWWRNRRVEVPTACAAFPKEISFTPRRWLEGRYNITRFSIMPRGGHFAALEQPELLVADVRTFFRELRSVGGAETGRGR